MGSVAGEGVMGTIGDRATQAVLGDVSPWACREADGVGRVA